MKTGEQCLRLRLGLTLQRFRHERGRGGGDGAARPLEAHFLDHAIRDFQVQRQPVTTQRVEALGAAVRSRQPPEILRGTTVVNDDVPIEISQVRHQANTSCALRTARNSASTSSHVLYSAKEARTVAGTPNRAITGMAQWWPVRTATPSKSRMVPTSWGCTPSRVNERMLALSVAVPMMRRPTISVACPVAWATSTCSG